MFNEFRQRIVHLQLYGKITQKMTDRLTEALTKTSYFGFQVELVTASINSDGGSLVQAKNISRLLQNFAKQHRVPLYTFSEDICFQTALVILTSGNRCYVNPTSVLGEVAYSRRQLGYEQVLKDYNIQAEFIHRGENKVRLNPYQKLKESDSEWYQNLIYQMEYQLKSEILENRGPVFHKFGHTNEDVEDKVFKPPVLLGEDAVKVGLVDGVMTHQQLVNGTYNGMRVDNLMKQFSSEQRAPTTGSMEFQDKLNQSFITFR